MPNPFLVDGVIIDKVKDSDWKTGSSGDVVNKPAAPAAKAGQKKTEGKGGNSEQERERKMLKRICDVMIVCAL